MHLHAAALPGEHADLDAFGKRRLQSGLLQQRVDLERFSALLQHRVRQRDRAGAEAGVEQIDRASP